MATSKKAAAGEKKAVRPWYMERVEMAARCRHGLTKMQRVVLMFLAMRCKLNRPGKTFVSVDYLSQIIGIDPSTVSRALAVLIEKGLIRRIMTGDIKTMRITKMNWALIRADEFVYDRPKSREQEEDEQLEDFAYVHKPFEPQGEALGDDADEPVDADQPEEGFSDRDSPASPAPVGDEPQDDDEEDDDEDSDLDDEPEQLRQDDQDFLAEMMEEAKDWGVAYDPCSLVGRSDVDIAAYCAKSGCIAQRIHLRFTEDGRVGEQRQLRVALPIDQYVALRLSEHCGREVTRAACAAFSAKAKLGVDLDLYSIVEYALRTPTWCDNLRSPTTRSPIALLMHQFEAIATAWIADGALTLYPDSYNHVVCTDITEDQLLCFDQAEDESDDAALARALSNAKESHFRLISNPRIGGWDNMIGDEIRRARLVDRTQQWIDRLAA